MARVMIAGLALCAGHALAQGTGEPATPPADPATDAPLNDPRLGDAPTPSRTEQPVAPVAPINPSAEKGLRDVPSVPGLSLLDYRLPGRRALPEGTFLSNLPGKVIKAASGDMIFVPAERGRTPIAPMVMHTTQRAEQLEAAMAGLDPSTSINLTGQVFTYRGRGYLLINAFSIDASITAASTANAEQIEAKAREQAAEGDARVADLLRDLETTRGMPRALQSVPLVNEAPVAEGAKGPKPPEEGTLLVNRRGRLVRLGNDEGRLAFTLDNDPDSPSIGALRLLPCRALEEIEKMAAARGDELVFTVSGRAMVFKGRAMLLPTLVQVVPPSDLMPLQ